MPAPGGGSSDSSQLTVNDISDPWVLRRRSQCGRARPRHISGRTESFADRRRTARSQHAHAGTVPAELPARAGHQRSRRASRRRRHSISYRSRQGRARRSAFSKRCATHPAGRRAPRRSPDAKSYRHQLPCADKAFPLMFRSGTYWACVCEIAVNPSTGAITVEKDTIAVDPGIVVNPLQLKRQVEGGAVMGISHALLRRSYVRRERRSPRATGHTYPIAEDGRHSQRSR